MPYRFLLAIALSVVCFAASPAGAELSLGALRLKFEMAVEEDGQEYEAKSAKLRAGYIGALERLKSTLGREEKLEAATQVLAEIEIVKEAGKTEMLPEGTDYRLKALRGKWEEEDEKYDVEHRQTAAELAQKYQKALDTRKRALTRAGKIREANVLKEEIERVELILVAAVEEEEEEEEEDLDFGLPANDWVSFYGGQEQGVVSFVSEKKVVFSWRSRDRIVWEKLDEHRVLLKDLSAKPPKSFTWVFDQAGKKFTS